MLTARCEERLRGVDTRLVDVVHDAALRCPRKFIVVEGLRTVKRQQELYNQGRTTPGKIVTWTMASKHIDGKAVDLAPVKKDGSIDWEDLAGFDAIAKAMFAAASFLEYRIRWGADWDQDGKPRERGETDSPHFELA